MSVEVHIKFSQGTLTFEQLDETIAEKIDLIKWDKRGKIFKSSAHNYWHIINYFVDNDIIFKDLAREYTTTNLELKKEFQARHYQEESIDSWNKNHKRGIIVLPTGSGKTIAAVLAIRLTQRKTLVQVPTLDLMQQWKEVLYNFFKIEIGLLGGGMNNIQDITVATYDSALIHMPRIGNQFGLAIYDECHHLPGSQYRFSALSNLAPFRLGLTATPERADGLQSDYEELTGAIVYRAHIDEMSGGVLSEYEIKTVEVELDENEREEYTNARELYINFVKENNINMAGANGWKNFIWTSSRSKQGRIAFHAYLRQKKISQAARGKEAKVWEIILRHRGERIIIFTQDNEMAYRIGKSFFLPVLTHQTKLKERQEFLDFFRNGTYPILVTSKVLNEGVDVPEANIAIIVSGSGSVREHVQRLGRILRPHQGKSAIFYELVSKHTAEFYVNQRRREHRAYKRSS